MPIVAIAGDGVYEAVAEVDLIVFNARTWDIEEYFIILIADTHICAHLAGITAHAWRGKLNPCGYVPAFLIDCGGQCQAAADGGHTITAGGGQQL